METLSNEVAGAVLEPAVEPLAYKRKAAAAVLGISETKFWHLASLPAGDPRKIRKTSYGTYPRRELERHLAAELGDQG